MNVFIISYDLNKKGKNYEPLFEKIKQIADVHCKPCLSTWIIASRTKTKKEIYDELRKIIDDDDYIVVAQLNSKVYAQPDKEHKDIMQKYFMITEWDEAFNAQFNINIT